MKKRSFICAICKKEFDIDWTEEEAEEELKEEFGENIKKEDCVQVCDDCYEKVKPKNNPKIFNDWKVSKQVNQCETMTITEIINKFQIKPLILGKIKIIGNKIVCSEV